MVLEISDNLTSEERHSIYKMLRLRVVVSADGPMEITGAFGGPLEACTARSARPGGMWLQIPEFNRTTELRFRALLTESGYLAGGGRQTLRNRRQSFREIAFCEVILPPLRFFRTSPKRSTKKFAERNAAREAYP